MLRINETESRIGAFIKKFGVVKLLRNCGCGKEKGIELLAIISTLIGLVFTGRNLYASIKDGKTELNKDPIYRFLNSVKANWQKFLISLAKKVYNEIDPLTSEGRIDCFVLDDTLYDKSRSTKLELLAKVYDHVKHGFCKGFRALTLGWTDGNTFLPLSFSLMASQKSENILCGMNDKIDKRTNGYKARKRAVSNTLDICLELLRNAVAAGFGANYVLCDSWFAFACFINKVVGLNLNVIAMLKDMPNQFYVYKGKKRRLSDVYQAIPKKAKRRGKTDKNVYFATVTVQMFVEEGVYVPMEITFIKAVGKKREWVAIGSTDTSLDEEEITRIYGKRWSIEVFFKTAKSDLAFAKEFQGRSYDMLIAHTTIVCVRYIMLAFECRCNDDQRTMGELFYLLFDEMLDIKLDESLRLVIETMFEAMGKTFDPSNESMRDFCTTFLGSLPSNLREKFSFSDNCES